jgi:hypothetical protein
VANPGPFSLLHPSNGFCPVRSHNSSFLIVAPDTCLNKYWFHHRQRKPAHARARFPFFLSPTFQKVRHHQQTVTQLITSPLESYSPVLRVFFNTLQHLCTAQDGNSDT